MTATTVPESVRRNNLVSVTPTVVWDGSEIVVGCRGVIWLPCEERPLGLDECDQPDDRADHGGDVERLHTG